MDINDLYDGELEICVRNGVGEKKHRPHLQPPIRVPLQDIMSKILNLVLILSLIQDP